jgi:hypothetical protein
VTTADPTIHINAHSNTLRLVRQRLDALVAAYERLNRRT